MYQRLSQTLGMPLPSRSFCSPEGMGSGTSELAALLAVVSGALSSQWQTGLLGLGPA